MSDFFDAWAQESEENARLVAQELLITEVTEAVWKMMQETGVTKSELAQRMQTTKGHVSQILSGSRNMTLRTLSDICFALGNRLVFNFDSALQENGWYEDAQQVKISQGGVRYTCADNMITPLDLWAA